MTFKEICVELANLNEQELKDINKLVVSRLNYMRNTRATVSILGLRPRQAVWFTNKQGQRVNGTVLKVNRTTVLIECPAQPSNPLPGRWKVAGSLVNEA